MINEDSVLEQSQKSSRDVTISVKHLTRVEGHGNISVNVKDGEITNLELAIVESPRFFEAFLRGRPWNEAPHITCRICGICSVGHTTASFHAMEAACGIQVTPQTDRLRKLILMGEELQSHWLHLYFLAVPDYLGVGSVIPLASSHPEVVQRALRMKKLANDICSVVGGRHIHPIAIHVGGVTHFPKHEDLLGLKDRLIASREDLKEMVGLFGTLSVPSFERDTEYLSLKDVGGGEYAFYDGDIVSTKDPSPTPVAEYRERVIEDVVPHSAAKHCRTPISETYAVGALARFNNNHEQLHPEAKRVAEDLGLRAICMNPFHNNTAQLIETVHCVERAIELIDELVTIGVRPEPLVKPTSFGRGAGATEVPRGVLFHEYGVDRNGMIEMANLIIPTGQNLANIEADMRALVPQLLDEGMDKDAITLRLEMLVRAYDPCISCATHLLDVLWVD
ncbi:MAG TPA: Ni/Fe hydrogenase subunit alpha [Phycisphaerae bacterium]|nr:Ni/Fe hydrogenase subunit alpha [Phycisphaerae bacterium]HRW52334.1 Ni/Fe hydrogenase subunit alpha [Phycisphaerae bacterium]